jgi:hypothetical protein
VDYEPLSLTARHSLMKRQHERAAGPARVSQRMKYRALGDLVIEGPRELTVRAMIQEVGGRSRFRQFSMWKWPV